MALHKLPLTRWWITLCILVIAILALPGCTDSAPVTAPPDATPEPKQSTPVGPAFSVSDLMIMPPEAKIRDTIGVSVLAANNGDETGTYLISLQVNGEVVASKEITMSPGESDLVSFKTSRETPGTFQVDVNGLMGTFVIIPPPDMPKEPPPDAKPGEPGPEVVQPDSPGSTEHGDWTIPTGSGTNLRAVHMGGNWGTNRTSISLLPEEYFLYLRDLNVNWVGVSVSLHADGSMDSTVELDYDEHLFVPTFRDDALRELISTFRSHGFNVYIHVAIDSGMGGEHPVERWQIGDPLMHREDPDIVPEFWPWRTDHPQLQSFVAEFWRTHTDSLVHVARIAQEEGAGMLTIGTEKNRLYRSRAGGRWPNHFLSDTPHQKMLPSTSSMGSHNDEIDVIFFYIF